MSQAYVEDTVNVEINRDKLPRSNHSRIYQVPVVDRPRGGPAYRFVKRLLDMAVAAVGLVVVCIPMLVIAAVIRADSPGPVIYRQERLGYRGKKFHILKFRSMRQDAEARGAQWTDEDDERITHVGHFLRKTRLDELPQLFNILLGQMSLVGPRPERECFYREFEAYIHGFSQRLMVKPGLTGLAQVSGGYDLPPEKKILYDMEYIQKQSLWLDLKCVFCTLRVVLFQDGAR